MEDEGKSKLGMEGWGRRGEQRSRRLGGLPASGELCKRFKTLAERINNRGPAALRHDRVSLRQMAS